MFKNINISRRLIILIALFTVILLIIGVTTLVGLGAASNATARVTDQVAEGVELNTLASTVQGGFKGTATDLYLGALTWAEADQALKSAYGDFGRQWEGYTTALPPAEADATKARFAQPLELLQQAFTEMGAIVERQDRAQLALFVLNDLAVLTDPVIRALQDNIARQRQTAQTALQESNETGRLFLLVGGFVIAVGIAAAVLLGVAIYRSIMRPISRIMVTVGEVARGNYQARSDLSASDELGALAGALDDMLQDKVQSLARAEAENEKLNESVIQLLEAVSRLSERDLTVLVPVTEDVTGPVADAMNLMTQETAHVLAEIRGVAQEVELAANTVKGQSDKVAAVAANERTIIEQTLAKLDQAAQAMEEIARLAKSSDDVAKSASKSTDTALDMVTETVEGMNEIRETISETEKRLKRLGDRSQEISGIVDLINSIAERTHVLALNAAMQAAAAGDAGRGFAVVADEVQRLAESSRNSTSQIAALVNNIQAETAETMATMNRSISQVVEGSARAERAGQQMRETRSNTDDLVTSVRLIADRSAAQARVTNELRDQAMLIQKSIQETDQELKSQTTQTGNLVGYSQRLLHSVQVFKLPSPAA